MNLLQQTFTLSSLSDHSVVQSSFSVPSHSRSPRITKHIRNIKSIDTNLFSRDLLSSSLYTHPVTILNSYFLQFSSTLTKLLDKYAPLRTISCPFKTRQPFINQEIINEKKTRSKLETIHRRDKSCPIKNSILTSKLNALPNWSLSHVVITFVNSSLHATLNQKNFGPLSILFCHATHLHALQLVIPLHNSPLHSWTFSPTRYQSSAPPLIL